MPPLLPTEQIPPAGSIPIRAWLLKEAFLKPPGPAVLLALSMSPFVGAGGGYLQILCLVICMPACVPTAYALRMRTAKVELFRLRTRDALHDYRSQTEG